MKTLVEKIEKYNNLESDDEPVPEELLKENQMLDISREEKEALRNNGVNNSVFNTSMEEAMNIIRGKNSS